MLHKRGKSRDGRRRHAMEKIPSPTREEVTCAMEMIFIAQERGVDRGRIISPPHVRDRERVAEALLEENGDARR